MPVVCLFKYLYQSDNKMNKDLTHGKIWVVHSSVAIQHVQ